MPDADVFVHGLKVYDEVTDRFGTITDAVTSPSLVFVRPLGGGREWQARRGDLRPARTSELLALRLRKEREGGMTTWPGL